MNQRTISTLGGTMLLSLLIGACVTETPEPADEPQTAPSMASEIDEDRDLGPSPEAAEIDLSVNERPCGDLTIAVISDSRAATYVFCASPSGRTGTLAFELLRSAAHASLLDEHDNDPVALLEQVLPEDADVPEWVVESIRTGQRVGAPDDQPFSLEAELAAEVSEQIALSSGSCADPAAFFMHASQIMWPSFYNEFVWYNPGSNYTIRDCVAEREFAHQSYVTSQRTASAYFTNAACAGSARMRSCNGLTLLRGQWRPGTSGEFSQYFTFWVPNGGLGKTKYYANSQHSCHPTRDRDDIRFRAESSPGAYHHFAASFVNRTYTVAGGNVCYTDPV